MSCRQVLAHGVEKLCSLRVRAPHQVEIMSSTCVSMARLVLHLLLDGIESPTQQPLLFVPNQLPFGQQKLVFQLLGGLMPTQALTVCFC